MKLVDRRLQLRLTTWFVILTVVTLGFQFLLFTAIVGELAMDANLDPEMIYASFMSACVKVLVISAGVVLPVTIAVGVLTTFRIAGPVYRFKTFLSAIRRGDNPPDVQIREGDELQELCDLLNDATRPMRVESGASHDPSREAA